MTEQEQTASAVVQTLLHVFGRGAKPGDAEFKKAIEVFTVGLVSAYFKDEVDRAVLEDLTAIKKDLEAIRQRVEHIGANAKKTSDVLIRVSRDGDSMLTVEE